MTSASVQREIDRSAAALRDLVWPAIGGWVGGGDLIPVETVRESDFARILDTAGGIDAWQHYKCGRVEWMRGIASRVQFYGPKDWESHTVRYRLPSGNETELHKRLRYNTGRGVIGPHLSIQAYVDDTGLADRLLSVGIARTADLLEAITTAHIGDGPCRDTGKGCGPQCWPRRGQGPIYTDTNRQDGKGFVVVEWRALDSGLYDHFRIWPETHRLNRSRGRRVWQPGGSPAVLHSRGMPEATA